MRMKDKPAVLAIAVEVGETPVADPPLAHPRLDVVRSGVGRRRRSDRVVQARGSDGRVDGQRRAQISDRHSENDVRSLGLPQAIIAIVLLTTGTSSRAPASVFEDPEYDACLLQYLTGAKLDFASQLIRQACDENYRDPAFTSDQDRAYNQCLLDHLQGIESLNAALEIQGACERRHDDE